MSNPESAPAAQGAQQVRVRMDERNMSTSYANAFRLHRTNEELLLDVGLNIALPPQGQPEGADKPQQPTQDILFQINHRLVLNYPTAKRLALALSQVVRQHEQQHGEINIGQRA